MTKQEKIYHDLWEAFVKAMRELEELEKEPDFEYPLFFEDLDTGSVWRFSSLIDTICVYAAPDSNDHIGEEMCFSAYPHTHNGWKQIPNNGELWDKALVECWDDDMIDGVNLRFYDAKNDYTFNPDTLRRNHYEYYNYKTYEGKWPQKFLDAYPKLEK